MDDWEAEDFVPPPPVISREQPKSPWEDEEQVEEEVKESWEEEDKPAPAPKPKKKEDKKGKKAATAAADDGKLSDPLAEKLRQQRLVEEADYQSTTELFKNKNPDQTLENFIPKSEDDFLVYAELIAHKLRPFEKSFHYLTLLKTVMKHAVTSLNAADAKVLASSLTVIANEKLKAEKDAQGKKKTAPKKKQLLVDKAEDDTLATGGYDDVDEYDFM
ncbi:hypothetical protein R1sor_024367 [Riccia sorocarpa]|uniref:Eukaryotic translation initiation factor 3 subunit J n=1 Tax=Riccia sorocarpa TaxID=122646 RepID=A0ABD3GRW0_9MARC